MADDRTNPISDNLSRPLVKNNRYDNPWDTWTPPQIKPLLKFILFTKDLSNIPSQQVLATTLPIIKPDFKQFDTSPAKGIRHMWIGHASSLLQMDGVTFLTDPVFSDRCSPIQFVGVKRFRPPPCTVEELPNVDFVLISHTHYDHLDYYSVLSLNQRFGDKLRWYVPAGLKSWMNDRGCMNVVEMNWWDEHIHCPDTNIKVVCTPAQHWCKRTPLDDNKVLWSSWCVLSPRQKFYFAGDTGYCPTFKEIGSKYGPFNLATIPIGAYHPREFLKPQHVDPGQAIDVHIDIKSLQSIGIHWGTFRMSAEFYLEPRELLKKELEKRSLDLSSFVTVNHGEVKVFGGDEVKSSSKVDGAEGN